LSAQLSQVYRHLSCTGVPKTADNIPDTKIAKEYGVKGNNYISQSTVYAPVDIAQCAVGLHCCQNALLAHA